MIDTSTIKQDIRHKGFSLINQLYLPEEVNALIAAIDNLNTSSLVFRKTKDLFAIRQFLKEAPQLKQLIFNTSLMNLINKVFGPDYFVVKSIYFDKPPQSNWFFAYHQDLKISVKEKAEVSGFENWTVKLNQFAVQPPLTILEDNFTVRIHLDSTTKANGALKVIPGSHSKGIYRPGTSDHRMQDEVYCELKSGGLMFMRPLLMHASDRTVNAKRRRVIHIEFSRMSLPEGPSWAEA